MVRTTIRVPEDLWRRVKIRAIDEGTSVQEIVTVALKAYLKAPVRKTGGAR